MANKRIETNRTPDGRFVWQIGEQDTMGGMFSIFFVDSESGKWRKVDEDGKTVFSNKDAVKTVYEGEFFDTAAQAITAGRVVRDAA